MNCLNILASNQEEIPIKFEAFEQCARGTNGIYYITEGTNAYISVTVTKTENLGSHTMLSVR